MSVPPARVHGGPCVEELEPLGLAPEDVLDFSVSTNPYGPSPAVVAAIRAAALAAYPDPACTLARRRLAQHLAVPPARLALGNGAADLLWALARALVGPRTTVLVVEPTFSELRTAATAAGGTIVEWRADPRDDFAPNVAAIADRARACRAGVVYLCAPGVPTGAALPAGEANALAASLPDAHIILDQSFLALSARAEDAAVPLAANIIAVRSLTKEHAIPGVRVGYLVASEAVLATLAAQRPAWSTSAPAQAAAIAACGEEAFVARSRARLLQDRARLASALAALDLRPVPSTTNYFVVRVGGAAALRQRLLANHRILVRDCASFGLPEHIRVSARPPADNQRLVAAMGAELRR
jgi:histidinol-phosphate/aromatic aminotransferase/cobyric acid decarboxylase-like protein